MSSRSSPLPTEPGSSSQSTLQSGPTTESVRINTPKAPVSLDDLLNSPHNPVLRSHQPSSTLKGASPDDPRRRSGFHLWRTESEDARNARLRRAIEAAEAQVHAPGTVTDRLRNRIHTVAGWISTRRIFSLYRRSSIQLPEGLEDTSNPSSFSIREPRLTRLGLIVLTLSLAGAQLAWTLELAYGTPYLLSLGLSEQSTSLVWLAGPLSGLIAQPVVGSLSDHSTSSFRRRKYMIISASLLTLSTLTLAYSVPISTALVDLFGGGLADWDPHRHKLVHSTTQAISVIAFWILDFALNGLQAASRALILDTAPSEQQTIANAWQGRMTHAGNVVGYLCGWVDLASWKGLRWLGGGQFRRFAMISLLAMISCVSVTISFISESPADGRFAVHHQTRESMCMTTFRKVKETVDDVWHAIRRLPRSVRRVCLVQLFAFMGWFPFLFYSTTYVLQIAQYERYLRREQKHDLYKDHGDESRQSSDKDAEQGSFAMLLFAIVSLISAALLPYLALAGEKAPRNKDQEEEDDSPTPPLRLDVHSSESQQQTLDPETEDTLSRGKRILRGLTQGLTLRTFWTLASIFFALLMLVGTAWASTVHQATVVIALVGVPWSIAAWAPFAMVGEFVREAEDGESPFEFEGDHWSPARTRARRVEAEVDRKRRGRSSGGEVEDGILSPGGGSGFKYIDPHTHAASPLRRPSHPAGEQGARDRIRASLVECAPLPYTLTRSSTDSLDESPFHSHTRNGGSYSYADSTASHSNHQHHHTGGAGTILGIHNLAIVAPQFIVAIIASLIFSAVHSSTRRIHLVLGQPLNALTPLAYGLASNVDGGHGGDGGYGGGVVVNPAEGTIWVLRFGGAMAILAALTTRFVPLTLSERRRRYYSVQRLAGEYDGEYDEEEEELMH
ncbi:related to General alpha-glucoside permease [Ustilago trichophora]|uniref:Related to General alpha-glucoside permease n=1 Tax=Ustilago trichophora TaxID=86804 RepID=A0A5C3E2S0_9BASI|nr:related to General alpha-glucoside permease [Ustilago trichophora]